MSHLRLVSYNNNKPKAAAPKPCQKGLQDSVNIRRSIADTVVFAVQRGTVKDIRILPDDTLGLELITDNGDWLMVASVCVPPGEVRVGDCVITGYALCKENLTDHPYLINLTLKSVWTGRNELEMMAFFGFSVSETAQWRYFLHNELLPVLFGKSGISLLHVPEMGVFQVAGRGSRAPRPGKAS